MDSITPVGNSFNLSVPMVLIVCPMCGVHFCISDMLALKIQISREDDEDLVSCPNQHHLFNSKYKNNDTGEQWRECKKKSKADRAAMTKKLHELHELEQAEARLSDQKAAAEKAPTENMVQGVGELAKGAKEAFEQARKISKAK